MEADRYLGNAQHQPAQQSLTTALALAYSHFGDRNGRRPLFQERIDAPALVAHRVALGVMVIIG